MKKYILGLLMAIMTIATTNAQNVKVYDETINPFTQIDNAVAKARQTNKFVICQLGGNWCPWCLRFAKFINDDAEIAKVIDENFEYIHVNYKSRNDSLSQKVSKRLGNASRFGFPVLVVLNTDGTVLHIQNSAYLEEGEGYNRKKVLEFFTQWTQKAVNGL
ncbi:MAG: DUF255 domain-containing protein [Prevotella sp.]|jgi:uncharacterized protein YyaL (SSP411 family)